MPFASNHVGFSVYIKSHLCFRLIQTQLQTKMAEFLSEIKLSR